MPCVALAKQGNQRSDNGHQTPDYHGVRHSSFCILHSAFCISSASHGQTLIESCIVIGLICLLLMGLFQLAQLFVAQEILDYAAERGARAKAVGFNDFMVSKTVRIGAIANAGALTFPGRSGGGPWVQWTRHESPRIPHYLQADNWELDAILNYALWDTISWSCPAPEATHLHFEVHQAVPLMFFSNVFKAFFAGSTVPMQGVVDIENHYPLYLQ